MEKEVIFKPDTLLEAVARAICKADDVDPDKEVCGMGIQLAVGEIAPAWRARMRQAEAAIDAINDYE
jgi:hypothetical protein